jgi:hypothetical protein
MEIVLAVTYERLVFRYSFVEDVIGRLDPRARHSPTGGYLLAITSGDIRKPADLRSLALICSDAHVRVRDRPLFSG